MQILSLLNKCGHTIAPSQLMELGTALAEQKFARIQGGAMLPSNIDQSSSAVFFSASENEFFESGNS